MARKLLVVVLNLEVQHANTEHGLTALNVAAVRHIHVALSQ
jgi:hypothetical protein